MRNIESHDEHSQPQKYCRAASCELTRLYGDYNRLHLRSDDCPPYEPVVEAASAVSLRQSF